jgi:hypothetical protein
MAYRFVKAWGYVEIPDNSPMWHLSSFAWLQEPEFIRKADEKLNLFGALIQYYQKNGMKWEPIAPMTEAEWNRHHLELHPTK